MLLMCPHSVFDAVLSVNRGPGTFFENEDFEDFLRGFCPQSLFFLPSFRQGLVILVASTNQLFTAQCSSRPTTVTYSTVQYSDCWSTSLLSILPTLTTYQERNSRKRHFRILHVTASLDTYTLMSTEYLGQPTGLGVGAGTTHDEARRRTVCFQLGNCASRVPLVLCSHVAIFHGAPACATLHNQDFKLSYKQQGLPAFTTVSGRSAARVQPIRDVQWGAGCLRHPQGASGTHLGAL